MGVQTGMVNMDINMGIPQKVRNRSTILSGYTTSRAIPKVLCILHRCVHDRLFYLSLSKFEVSALVVRISCHGEFWKNGHYVKFVQVVEFPKNCYMLYWYVTYCFGY